MYSHANVTLWPTGERAALFAGDVIGRGPSSVLPLRDPRVHEAHAVVSFRDGELCLLPARGTLYPLGEAPTRAPMVLRAGLSIALRSDGAVGLRIDSVRIFTPTLAIACDGVPAVRLHPGSTYTIRVGAVPWVTEGADEGADAVVWLAGEDWYVRPRGGTVSVLDGRSEVMLPGGQSFIGVDLVAPVERTLDTTRILGGSLGTPLEFALVRQPSPIAWSVEARSPGRHRFLEGARAYFLGRLLEARALGRDGVATRAIAHPLWPERSERGDAASNVYDLRRRVCRWLAELDATTERGVEGAQGQLRIRLHPDDVVVVKGGVS
jgi:hypothetical protein